MDKKEMQNIDKEIDNKQQELDKLMIQKQEIAAKRKEQMKEILLDALIIGAGGFKVRHGMTAPYSHGYYAQHEMMKEFCKPVTCDSVWTSNIPELLYKYLEGKGWTDADYEELKVKSDSLWSQMPDKYDATLYEPSKTYLHGNHVASGYEVDGFYNIVKGRCGGTYSSMTTTTQNDLSRELIILKGYCAEEFLSKRLRVTSTEDVLKAVYQRHGIDSDFSSADGWAENNPTRCMADNKYYKS